MERADRKKLIMGAGVAVAAVAAVAAGKVVIDNSFRESAALQRRSQEAVIAAQAAMGPRRADPPATAAPPAPATIPNFGECVLAIPGEDETVPAFPTEDGLQQWVSLTRSQAALRTLDASIADPMSILVMTGGKTVEPGTRCDFVDRGSVTSQVKVRQGRRRGQTLWVMTTWTQGLPRDGG